MAILFLVGVSFLAARNFLYTTGYQSSLVAETDMPSSSGAPIIGGILPAPSGGPTVDAKQGSMTIDSTNADKDADAIQNYTKSYGGYMDSFQRTDLNDTVTIVMTSRIPSTSFDTFFNQIKSEFNVKDSDANFHKIPIGNELNEIDILNATLTEYKNMRASINAMPDSKDKIDLLLQLTNN